jgi:thiol-disulfide isomerase/thioredoxin
MLRVKYSFMRLTQILLLTTLLLMTAKVFAEDLALSQQEKQEVMGQWKIVNYWSLWCGPCRIEIPELNLFHKELKHSEVVLVGVNFDEDPRDKTLKIANRMGIEFPTLDIDSVRNLQLDAPSVLPTTYILDSKNNVMAKLIGAQDRASLKKVLSEKGFKSKSET